MTSAAQQAQAPVSLAITGGVCDLSKRTYFHATISGNTTLSFINAPADVMIFNLEINLTSGTLSWPGNVRWAAGQTPSSLQTGKIHVFQFQRPQSTGADQWLGSYLQNF
ncbi:hypothetical protein GCM10027082_24700 [Comamonas humi]